MYHGTTTGVRYVCFSLNGHNQVHVSCRLHGVSVCHHHAILLNPVCTVEGVEEHSEGFPSEIPLPVLSHDRNKRLDSTIGKTNKP